MLLFLDSLILWMIYLFLALVDDVLTWKCSTHPYNLSTFLLHCYRFVFCKTTSQWQHYDWLYKRCCSQLKPLQMFIMNISPNLYLSSSFPRINNCQSFHSFFFKVKTIYFYIVEGSKQNWGEDTEISHLPLSPTHAQPPPLSISLTWVVHLLKFINLLHFFPKCAFYTFLRSMKYSPHLLLVFTY